MIYCPKCGIANREGSRFCNDCGTKLPSSTSVHCPHCGAPNPPNNVFCEQCNTRLIPALADEAPEAEPTAPVKKGLSLPTKPAAPEAQPAGDWLDQLRSSMEAVPDSEEPAASEPAGELPDWFSRLNEPSSTSEPAEPPAPTAAGDEVPDWLTSLGLINPTETPAAAESTEWLAQTPPEAPVEEHPPEPEPAAWISSLRETGATPAEDDVPEWLRELGTAPLKTKSSEPPAPPPTGYEEEIPDWLHQLGTGALIPSSSNESESERTVVQLPSPPPPAPPEEPASSYEGELPDWLRGLGTGVLKPPAAEQPAPAAEPPAPAEPWLNALRASAPPSQEDIPDWLQNLGTGALTPPEERSAEASEPSAESPEYIPDWLRNLGTGALTLPEVSPSAAAKPIEPEPSPPEPPESAAPEDWLSALRAAAPVNEEEAAEQAAAPVEPSESSAPEDWLSALRAAAPINEEESTEQAVAPVEPTESAAPEDWLGALRAAAPVSEEESTEPEVEPAAPAAADDWLSVLRAATPEVDVAPLEEEQVAEAPIEPAESEVPDWLQSLGALPPVEPETAPAVAEEPIEPEPAPAAQPELAADDWLSALRAAAPLAESEPEISEEEPTIIAESQAKAEEAPAVSAAEMPDWLSSFPSSVPPAQTEPEPMAEPNELPDWLRETAAPETAIEASIKEVPDWLRGESETIEVEAPVAEPAAARSSDEEVLPDWLRDMRGAEPTAAPAVDDSEVPDWLREAASEPEPETPAVEAPALTAADDLPDWLREAATTPPSGLAEIEEPSPAEETIVAAEPATELPAWLTSMQPGAPTPVIEPSQPEPTSAAPATNLGAAFGAGARPPREGEAVPAELPDWLKSLRAGQPTTAPSQPVAPVPGLTQAEIPSWLEALRPKEGAAESLADVSEETEQEGVLAGLSHLLPAAPSLSAVPGAPAKLQVEPSADDLARAGIFQELLSRPISAPTQVGALPSRALRVRRNVTQIIVAAVLLIVMAVPFFDWRLPFLPVSDALPPSPSVQAAVDTISNLSTEAHVLVVFDYDGTQAGEMNQIASIMLRHLKAHGANVTAASLNPQGTSLAQTAWNSIGLTTSPALFVPGQALGVQSLMLDTGPYDLVIALSATADDVRWWVEQLAIISPATKFIAGVSAGAEPLALPYARSKQIAGLVSGAVGALQYAHQAQLLPTVEEAYQAEQAARQTAQGPSLEVVATIRGQLRLESQTLAHWVMIGVIVLGFISGLVTRGGRRSA